MHQINATNTGGFNIVLGGTALLNTDKFVNDMMDVVDRGGR